MSFPQQSYGSVNPTSDQLMRWNGNGDVSGFMDGTGVPPANPYDLASFAPEQTSNTLARRPMSALVPTNASFNANGQWAPYLGDDGALVQQGSLPEDHTTEDSIEVLEEKAQKAKRDAQGKRKTIPPFVQKLSSFLEEGKNEDLIRWSEKGDSFIVLDEDEFAKTLIPELFKHNNYASFVRQLNMYGFHKRVGLSDNSMRASERKNKSPSEYSNPFFRRGHPNLLWLINKPKSGSKAKKGGKGADADNDSDEDAGAGNQHQQPTGVTETQTSRTMPAVEQQPLQKKEITLIREELAKLREQQSFISGALNRLQRNNDQLYNQAMRFQTQHDRHQNSINAILSFLANVFRKTLEDQGGNAQNVGDIISSLMSNQGGTQATGNVVDLGDFIQSQVDPTHMGGAGKRTRGLLPPIPDSNTGRASTQSRGSSAAAPTYQSGNNSHNPQMGHVTELFETSPSETPPSLRQELESNPQERMMKIINDHNATNSSGMDLPEAEELVANAPNTLDSDQRRKLVSFMASQNSGANMPNIPATASPPIKTETPGPAPNTSLSPQPTPPSLSPIMRSPAMPPPSLHQIGSNANDLAELQRIQSEQAARINELNDMLGPLSPSGRIPGLTGDGSANVGGGPPGGENYFDPNGSVDFDQFFDSNAFLNDQHFGDGNDFNFNLDGSGDPHGMPPLNTAGGPGGLEVPTRAGGPTTQSSGNNTPSPAGTEEIPRADFMAPTGGLGEGAGNKRRRMG
ncbi:hypothetical protein CC79DRAFT_1276339 [Sarocladium strictum]